MSPIVVPSDAVQQIEAVLYKLHCKGYVFGDLRAQNVLFDEGGKVKFIDFDWSGRYDMNIRDKSLPAALQKSIDDEKNHVKSVDHYVCYPLNLSSKIHWAPDARDLDLFGLAMTGLCCTNFLHGDYYLSLYIPGRKSIPKASYSSLIS
jgi:serine/threonine protein kinase